MGFFKEVEGEAAVIVESGIYKQVSLFTRDGFLYAKTGGGYVRLLADGSTTKAKLRLDSMTWTGPLHRDALGRLCEPSNGTKPLDGDRRALLLGAPE